jgi:hypothetical protein
MIVDHTPNRPTVLKKKAQRVNKNFILENVVSPIRSRIMNEMLKEFGATDPFSYADTPEKQLEFESQINQRLEVELPRDVIDFINGNVQSTTARQAQKMINYLKDKFDIHLEQVKGFKNAVVTGEEYYYSGEYNGNLLFQAINPMHFSWGGGDKENEWSQFSDWAKRERWLSYQQTISRHADRLTPKDLQLIDLDIEPIGGYRRGTAFWDKDAAHTKKLMWTYSRDEGFREAFSNIDINTKDGRRNLQHMYNLAFTKYGEEYGRNYSDYGIREAHIQWRDLRKMWIIKRRDKTTGVEKTFWLPEHYEPTHLDYNVKETWKNQVWEGWKLGTFDAAYVGVRELPYQYKSIFNPHDVDLSYYGKKYNTHDNTTGNISLVDLGKTPNKNFDIVLASIRHDMTTNQGKAFTLYMNMKPEKWSYQDWLDLLRNAGILMIDPNKVSGSIGPEFFKQFDLSKVSDIAGKLQMLEFYRSQVGLSMFFNEAREGQISQYANSTNVQQNTIAVHNKTSFFMEQHRIVVEKALTGLLNRARHYYRDNIEEASIFLDDVSLSELQSAPLSYYEWFGIELKNSDEELHKLNMLKEQMLGFIQNGSSPEAIMEIIFADTTGEVSDVIRTESKRIKLEKEGEFQRQMELQQQETQSKMQEKQAEMELEWQKHVTLLESQEKRTMLDREKFMMQNDVDRNQVSDLIQKTLIEIEGKLAVKDKEIDFEKEKMRLLSNIDKEKLKNDKEKFKISATKQQKKPKKT